MNAPESGTSFLDRSVLSPRGKIVLLTNGPGELWGWVRPLAAELLRRCRDVEIRILPCQFASGEERRIALSLRDDLEPSASARRMSSERPSRFEKTETRISAYSGEEAGAAALTVSGPESSVRTFFSLSTCARKAVSFFSNGAKEERADAVIQLGGDLLWGRMLSSRSRAPLFCYSYGRKSGMDRCDALFTAYPAMADAMRSKPKEKVDINEIGDLVLDSLDMPSSFSGSGTNFESEETDSVIGPRVAFFPGSRGNIRKYALPMISETVHLLRERFPTLVPLIVLSPFAPRAEQSDNSWRAEGLQPIRGGSRESLRGVDFAVTQPGTNTLELMHCAVPFLVAVPFSSLRHVPLSGIAGTMARVPLLGPFLRESFLKAKGRRMGFLAWPNRIAGRTVVDEMIGEISAGDIAERVAKHLLDEEGLARMRKELSELSSPKCSGQALSAPGAAKRIADHIERMLAVR